MWRKINQFYELGHTIAMQNQVDLYFYFYFFFKSVRGILLHNGLKEGASVQVFFAFSLFCLVGRSKMKPIPTSRAGLFSIVKIHYLKFNETARKLLAIFRPRAKLSIVVIVSKRDFLCGLMTRS